MIVQVESRKPVDSILQARQCETVSMIKRVTVNSNKCLLRPSRLYLIPFYIQSANGGNNAPPMTSRSFVCVVVEELELWPP